jgi:hypothetical protein
MKAETGGIPQPDQPTKPKPEQDLFLAKGDPQKGREVSGIPPPADPPAKRHPIVEKRILRHPYREQSPADPTIIFQPPPIAQDITAALASEAVKAQSRETSTRYNQKMRELAKTNDPKAVAWRKQQNQYSHAYLKRTRGPEYYRSRYQKRKEKGKAP